MSKQQQRRVMLDQADRFINSMETRLQPPAQLSLFVSQNASQLGQNKNLFPFNCAYNDNLPDCQIEAYCFKNIDQLLKNRLTYQRDRHVYIIEENNRSKINKNQLDKNRVEYSTKQIERANQQRLYFQKRKFILSSNGIRDIQNRNIPIQNYQYFYVQDQLGWKLVKNQVKVRIDQLKTQQVTRKSAFQRFLSFIKQNEKPKYDDQAMKKVSDIASKYFLLTQYWHEPQVGFEARIICISRSGQGQGYGHLYIYFKQRPFMQAPQIPEPLTRLSAANLQRILTFVQFSSKNQQRARRIQDIYADQTKKVLGQKFIFQKAKQNVPVLAPQIIRMPESTKKKILTDYPKQNSRQLIYKWLRTAQQLDKRSTMFIYIQPEFIYIPKTILVNQIDLFFNKQENPNQKQQLPFRFVGQNEHSFIFEAQNVRYDGFEHKNTYQYQLIGLPKREMEFVVKIIDQAGRQENFRNTISASHVQNLSLGFSYQMALIPDNKSLLTDNIKGDFPFILVFQAAMKKSTKYKKPKNLKQVRQIKLLNELGKVPNIYSWFYDSDYSPDYHPIVSEVLQGVSSPINTKNFVSTYLRFVEFCQKQQNKSQNYCQYISMKGLRRSQNSGNIMRDRYSFYSQALAQTMNNVSKNYQSIFRQGSSPSINRELFKNLQNLKNDLRDFDVYEPSKVQAVIERFILYHYFVNKYSGTQNNALANTNKITYSASLIEIAQFVSIIYDKSSQQKSFMGNIDQLSVFFIAFIQALYPYHKSSKNLKDDLLRMRISIQKYIPQFNYLLNRKGIGLQNYASSYLLQLFSNLPMELCFRIWDLLIINIHRVHQMRLVSLYTIMLYQQKSNLIPIFPINQMIQSIHQNSKKIKLDESAFYNMKIITQNFNNPILGRQTKIADLAIQKYLKRFAYGKTTKQEELLDQDNFQKGNKKPQALNIQRVHAKLTSLKQISYPLPVPGFNGYQVQKICIFISSISLLGNINIHSKKYRLLVNLAGNNQIKDDVIITEKSIYVNKFLQLNFYQQSLQVRPAPILQLTLVEEQPRLYVMSGKIRLQGYHKDIVYRQNLILKPIKKTQLVPVQINSNGTSVVNIAFCLKSNKNQVRIQSLQQKMQQQTLYMEKILDFDLSPENNQVIKSMQRLDNTLKKVMDPLDQLDAEKYLNLKVATSFLSQQAEWIKNSKVSVEELKAIFGYIFSEESEKNIRLNLPTYYQNYTQNYQKFQLGKFLLQLILMSTITKTKKLSMLFCIGVHYQNIYQQGTAQKLSVQTANSIIYEMMKSAGFINACPFQRNYFGQILYACYYEKGSKVEENKKQITQILQDWAYICQIKSHHGGIMLGTANDLSVLRAMIPLNILRQIQRDPLCRFEIHYRVNGQVFIWSATVNTADFTIAKRGVKFLNSYPKYTQIKGYLSTIADLLYNCQNFISLEDHRGVRYKQFINIFNENALLDYILTSNEYLSQNKDPKDSTIVNNYLISTFKYASDINFSDQAIVLPQKLQRYNDYAVFRHQNCLPSWKKCRVTDDGLSLVKVQFKDNRQEYEQNQSNYNQLSDRPVFKPVKQTYLVPKYEVINLSEVELANLAQTQLSQTEMSQKMKVSL